MATSPGLAITPHNAACSISYAFPCNLRTRPRPPQSRATQQLSMYWGLPALQQARFTGIQAPAPHTYNTTAANTSSAVAPPESEPAASGQDCSCHAHTSSRTERTKDTTPGSSNNGGVKHVQPKAITADIRACATAEQLLMCLQRHPVHAYNAIHAAAAATRLAHITSNKSHGAKHEPHSPGPGKEQVVDRHTIDERVQAAWVHVMRLLSTHVQTMGAREVANALWSLAHAVDMQNADTGVLQQQGTASVVLAVRTPHGQQQWQQLEGEEGQHQTRQEGGQQEAQQLPSSGNSRSRQQQQEQQQKQRQQQISGLEQQLLSRLQELGPGSLVLADAANILWAVAQLSSHRHTSVQPSPVPLVLQACMRLFPACGHDMQPLAQSRQGSHRTASAPTGASGQQQPPTPPAKTTSLQRTSDRVPTKIHTQHRDAQNLGVILHSLAVLGEARSDLNRAPGSVRPGARGLRVPGRTSVPASRPSALDERWLSLWLEACLRCVHWAGPQAIAISMWALAKLRCQCSPRQLSVLQCASVTSLTQGPGVTSQGVAMTVWGLGTLRMCGVLPGAAAATAHEFHQRKTKTRQRAPSAADSPSLGIQRPPAQRTAFPQQPWEQAPANLHASQQTNRQHSMPSSTLGHQHREGIQEVPRDDDSWGEEAGPGDVWVKKGARGRTPLSPAQQETVAAAVHAHAPHMTPAAVLQVLHGLALLTRSSKTHRLNHLVKTLLPQLPLPHVTLRPSELATLLWDLAVMRSNVTHTWQEEQFWPAVQGALDEAQLHSFAVRDAAQLMWAAAALHCMPPDGLVDRLLSACQRDLAAQVAARGTACVTSDLLWCSWAAHSMGCQLEPTWLDLVSRAVLSAMRQATDLTSQPSGKAASNGMDGHGMQQSLRSAVLAQTSASSAMQLPRPGGVLRKKNRLGVTGMEVGLLGLTPADLCRWLHVMSKEQYVCVDGTVEAVVSLMGHVRWQQWRADQLVVVAEAVTALQLPLSRGWVQGLDMAFYACLQADEPYTTTGLPTQAHKRDEMVMKWLKLTQWLHHHTPS